MKKYGKFEKQAAPSAVSASSAERETARKKELKSALLQTYFTSLLCLVLCVSMFFGTSYAWFTSEVTNSNNQIHVGSLKVKLMNGDKQDLSGDHQLFDQKICWTPGYTMLETVHIENGGELAFNYVMSFVDAKPMEGNSVTLGNITNCFEVWVYDHQKHGDLQVPANYTALCGSSQWSSAKGEGEACSLSELLAGTPVLSGDMGAAKSNNEKTVHTYTIAVHMRESAASEVMGQSLTLGVKLVAYQATTGNGDVGGGSSSGIKPVSTAKDLKAAAEDGKIPVLTSDITLTSAEDRIVMKGSMLDGGGKKLTYTGEKVNGSSVGIVTTKGGSVTNLMIDSNDNGRALYVEELTSDLTVTGCNLNGAYSFNLNSNKKTDHVVRFVDSYLNDWTSYANVVERVEFTRCEFADVLRPYGDTVLTGCKFTREKLDLSHLELNESVTLIDCKYNETNIGRAVFTRGESGITIEGTELLKLNDSQVVILAKNG